MTAGDALWRYFADVRAAVDAAHRGEGAHPYRHGRFVVAAVADDIEITVKDVSEEDAILIADDLRSLGARVVVRGARACPHCGSLVPDQARCVVCRGALGGPPSD
jgi:hypothetical protein